MDQTRLAKNMMAIVSKSECAKYYMSHIRKTKLAEDAPLRDFDLQKIGQLDELVSELSVLSNGLLDEILYGEESK